MNTDPTRGNLRSSWQEHDIWYVVDRVHEHFPALTRIDVEHAVKQLKREVQPSAGRDKLVQRVKKQLKILS